MEQLEPRSQTLRLALSIGQARLSRAQTLSIAQIPLGAAGYVSLPYYVKQRRDGMLFATGEPYQLQAGGYGTDLHFCGSYGRHFALTALPSILDAVREADLEFTYDYLFDYLNEHDFQEAQAALAGLRKSSCAIEFVEFRWLDGIHDGVAGYATLRLSNAIEVRRCRIILSGMQFWLWAPLKRTESQWGIVFEHAFEQILAEHLRDAVREAKVPPHLRFAQSAIHVNALHCLELSA